MARLLIVEDDEDIRDLIAELLVFAGHQVSTAADGEEGLARLREATPDVVLLDVEMPSLDGPAMALRMRQSNHGWDKIPVVLLSGSADLRLVARRVGTPYFLAKPADLDSLLRTVELAVLERTVSLPELGQ